MPLCSICLLAFTTDNGADGRGGREATSQREMNAAREEGIDECCQIRLVHAVKLAKNEQIRTSSIADNPITVTRIFGGGVAKVTGALDTTLVHFSILRDKFDNIWGKVQVAKVSLCQGGTGSVGCGFWGEW